MTESSEIPSSQLPNPFTPLAFLTPELADQKTMTTYIIIGMLGILIWDILTHLRADYTLLTRNRLSISTIIYYLSRWSCLLYSVTSVVFETAQIENCEVLATVACSLYHPAVATTALLFLFRVRAVYDGNKYITAVFLVMWLAVLGTSLTVIMSLTGAHIGNTKYCMFVKFHPYGSSSNIAIGVFDTCVFIAISWRLLANAPPAGDIGTKSRFGLFGKYLPRFSRALLQDGQNYYMVAMACNLLVVIMTYARGIPTAYRPLFLVPSVGLTNIMACRVFRNTKLGHPDETNTTGTFSIMFRQSRYTTSDPVDSQHPRSTVHSISGRDLRTSISDTEISSSEISTEKRLHVSQEVSAV